MSLNYTHKIGQGCNFYVRATTIKILEKKKKSKGFQIDICPKKIHKWHIKRCSTSLIIREMQTKVMRYDFTNANQYPLGWLLSTKNQKTNKENRYFLSPSINKNVEKLKPLCIAGADVKFYSHCENQYSNTLKD